MGGSKRGRESAGPAALELQAALYQYLLTEKWGKKAAKALLKKNEKLGDIAPSFDIGKLFRAIIEELEGEKGGATKKQRIEPESEVKAPKEVTEPIEPLVVAKSAGPLKRLNVEYWEKKSKVADNSYAAKGGDGFAARAAQDLGKVRGKSFCKEKNKKKRSSWKGCGDIDTGTHSVFFSDHDSD